MTTEIGEGSRTEIEEDTRTEVEEVLMSEAEERGRDGKVIIRETAGSILTSEAQAEVEAGAVEKVGRTERTRGRRRLGRTM